MTKDEMRIGLAQGRRLRQEEWSNPGEIDAVNELVSEGVATATPWAYRHNFQCMVRDVTGKQSETPHE